MGIELGKKISQFRKKPGKNNLVIRSRFLRRRLIGMIENSDKRKELEEKKEN